MIIVLFRILPPNERDMVATSLNKMLSCQLSSLPPQFFLSEMLWWYPHHSTKSYTACLARTNVTAKTLRQCRAPIKNMCPQEIYRYNEWWPMCHSMVKFSQNFQQLQAASQLDFLPKASISNLYKNELLNKMLTYQNCLQNVRSKINHCIQQLELTCQSAKVRVVKTIRLGMDIINQVKTMSKQQNFKVIHLLRDPRAMLHSRRLWIKALQSDLKTLCVRMKNDLIQFNSFRSLYPRDYLQVRYDDLIRNLHQISRNMYDHISVSPPGILAQWLRDHTEAKSDNWIAGGIVRKNATLHIDQWRKNKNMTLLFESMKQISDCSALLQEINWT